MVHRQTGLIRARLAIGAAALALLAGGAGARHHRVLRRIQDLPA